MGPETPDRTGVRYPRDDGGSGTWNWARVKPVPNARHNVIRPRIRTGKTSLWILVVPFMKAPLY